MVERRPQPPRAPPNDDKGVVLAIGGGAFTTGLYFLGTREWIFGGFLTCAGLLALASISPYMRSTTRRLVGRRALWALGITTWLLLAANVGLTL